MGNLTESLGEIRIVNVHLLPLINQAGYFVVEGNQDCQAQSALGESIPVFPIITHKLICKSS